jgi:hypothetical protein
VITTARPYPESTDVHEAAQDLLREFSAANWNAPTVAHMYGVVVIGTRLRPLAQLMRGPLGNLAIQVRDGQQWLFGWPVEWESGGKDMRLEIRKPRHTA